MKKAETNVQFFSHLNGLTLDNKWGEMIRLLDACLVYGLKLPDISTIEIQEEGKILIEFKSQHKCLLFQCVTLSDFTPSLFNDKYRIIGVPTQTQILISSDLEKQSIDKIGTASLSSLDYEIVFSANTKRVYRAKNPTPQHPFIRVDESTASEDDSGIYNENYAKYAMVGLHENMTHIDDYLDASKLQLPLNTSDLSANYKITGTGSGCVRGWSRWYWAKYSTIQSFSTDSTTPNNGLRAFSLFGNKDAFYFSCSIGSASENTEIYKKLNGCGLFNTNLSNESIERPWFLMTYLLKTDASAITSNVNEGFGSAPLFYSTDVAGFFTTQISTTTSNTINAKPIFPDHLSGSSGLYSGSSSAILEIPFSDSDKRLRGTLKHTYYIGSLATIESSITPVLSDTSMYAFDSLRSLSGAKCAIAIYLGEL